MTRLIIVFTFFFAFFNAIGQTTISGKVVQSNSTPIPGATVMLEGTYEGAVSNENGEFKFETKQKGTQNLIIKFIGFQQEVQPLEISTSPIELIIKLKEDYNELNTVTIAAGSFEAGDKKKSVSLNAIDMATVAGAQGNVVGALQYLPGTSTNGESGKLFVRGGNSRENQVYIDGSLVPVAYNPSAPNTAVRSKFNPFLFDGTVFSTGGFSAEYGQALSSVLLLETKGVQEQDQLDISILSVGLGLAGTKKWDKGAVTLSLDHTNLLPYLAIFPQNIDWVEAPMANNAGFNFRQKTKKGLFKAYASYNDAYFNLNQSDINNEAVLTNYDLQNKNYYINTSWKGQLGKSWIAKVNGSITHDKMQIKIAQDNYEESLYAGHFKSILSRKVFNRVKLKMGAELLVKKYEQNFETPTEAFPLSFSDLISAAFIETEIRLSKKWVTRVGGRYEHASYISNQNFSPRFSMSYQTGENSQLSLAGGTFYQQSKNKFLIYTDQLAFEKANQVMLNFQYAKKKRIIRAEVFYKAYNQLTKFNSENTFFEPQYYTNEGNGYAQGLDLFYRDKKTIRNGDFWISYSFLDTKRNELNYKNSTTPSYASAHNISFVYKHWVRKWRSLIGASFNYASPRAYNDPNSSVFNSGKTKHYQSLNLNWTYLHRENILFYGSASNVLGYQQEFGYEFSETPNSQGIYEQRVIQPPAKRFFILGCFITLSKSGNKNQLDKIE